MLAQREGRSAARKYLLAVDGGVDACRVESREGASVVLRAVWRRAGLGGCLRRRGEGTGLSFTGKLPCAGEVWLACACVKARRKMVCVSGRRMRKKAVENCRHQRFFLSFFLSVSATQFPSHRKENTGHAEGRDSGAEIGHCRARDHPADRRSGGSEVRSRRFRHVLCPLARGSYPSPAPKGRGMTPESSPPDPRTRDNRQNPQTENKRRRKT